MKVLELAVRQALKLVVDGVEYRVEFPLSAVAILEDRLGRAMRSPLDWFRISTKELPAVLEVGLYANHEEQAEALAQTICAALDPESAVQAIEALCATAFPAFIQRVELEMQKARERGEQPPNAQSGAGH